MLHLGYRKFIQINAKDQKLPWMLRVFVLPVRQLNKKRMSVTGNAIL